MAHVDLGEWRFEGVVPLRDWRPTDPTPAHYGFFIVSNPPGEWEAKGIDVKRRIGLFAREDLTSDLATRMGGFETWVRMWETALKPGDCIAVGTYAMPGATWLEYRCTGSDILMKYFTETRPQ